MSGPERHRRDTHSADVALRATTAKPAAARILVVAGEASSDLHCSSLVKELRELRPELSFVGIGGDKMRAQGVELIAHARELGVVGVSEVLRKSASIVTAYKEASRLMRSGEIAATILVDYPEFNLRLAARARRCGIPVLYYISPQVWAWRPGRIKKISRLVNKMLVLFHFEEQLYRDAGLSVEFVGHPLLDAVRPDLEREAFICSLGLDPKGRLIVLLPGSRSSEIENLLPVFLEASRLASRMLRSETPQTVLALADTIDRSTVAGLLAQYPEVVVVQGQTYNALNAADAALVASGTATLEAAILGVPMVVGYRVSLATYLLGKLLIRVDHVALPNIMAGKEVVPELIQNDLTPDRMARELASLVQDAVKHTKQRTELQKITELLGQRGASKRAAAAVGRFLDSALASQRSG